MDGGIIWNKTQKITYKILLVFNGRDDITLTDKATLKKDDKVFNSGGVNNESIGKVHILSVKEYMKKYLMDS